jgi:hypothetical protein
MVDSRIDRLMQRFQQKQQEAREAQQAQMNHKHFVDAHGYKAWQDVLRFVKDACQHANKQFKEASINFDTSPDQDMFFVETKTNSESRVLRVELKLPTRQIEWSLTISDGQTYSGTLSPTRAGDDVRYTVNGDDDELSVEQVGDMLGARALGVM